MKLLLSPREIQTKTIGSSMYNDEISVVYVWAYYTLYCMCVITSRRTQAQQAAAAEEDKVREQQLKRMQLGSSS